MDVAQVERLSVGFLRVEAVGTAKEMASLVSAAAVVRECCAHLGGEQGVRLERVSRAAVAVEGMTVAPVVAIPGLIVRLFVRGEAIVPFVGSPAASLEAGVVADAVVQRAVRQGVDDESIRASCLEGGNFEPVHRAVPDGDGRSRLRIEGKRQGGVPVGVRQRGRRGRIVATACQKAENKKRCRQTNVSAPHGI